MFGIWYGKGPGRRPLRRRLPPRQHGRHLEARRRAGADGRRPHRRNPRPSRTSPSSHFVDAMIPILNPGRRAGDPRLRPLRLRAVALRRLLGRHQMRQGQHRGRPASVDGRSTGVKIVIPDDFAMPPGGLNIRRRDDVLDQEARLHDYKRDAMLGLRPRQQARPHRLLAAGATRRSASSPSARAISTCARRWTSSASTRSRPNDMGLRLYKVGLPWPLDRSASSSSSRAGLELIIVVEEKRSLIEVQVTEELYGTAEPAARASARRTRAATGCSRSRARSIPTTSPSPSASGCSRYHNNDDLRGRVSRGSKQAQARARRRRATSPTRTPYFCSGCPHNTSTRRARGHRAPTPASAATTWRSGWTATPTASPRWAARAPTGSARRRSPSASTSSRTSATAPTTIPASWRSALRGRAPGVNITYKILFNDAVAMTGGQPHRGRPDRRHDRPPGARRGRRAHRARHRRAGQVSDRRSSGRRA